MDIGERVCVWVSLIDDLMENEGKGDEKKGVWGKRYRKGP